MTRLCLESGWAKGHADAEDRNRYRDILTLGIDSKAGDRITPLRKPVVEIVVIGPRQLGQDVLVFFEGQGNRISVPISKFSDPVPPMVQRSGNRRDSK